MKSEHKIWNNLLSRSWIIIIFSFVLPLFIYPVYPTLDGSAHIYNSSILREMLLNSESFFHQFFIINSWANPNWLDHIILAFLSSFLPCSLAEKVFVFSFMISYVLLLFRLFKVFNVDNKNAILINFIMIPSFFLISAFYNFLLGLLFSLLAFNVFNSTVKKVIKYISLSVLFILLYYTNSMMLGFTGIILGLTILLKFESDRSILKLTKETFQELAYLAIASLPSLILLAQFLKKSLLYSDKKPNDLVELTHWILAIRPVILFRYELQSIITSVIFILLAILMYASRSIIIMQWRKYLPFAIATWLALFLMYFVPAKSGAGMMTYRFCHIFFFFFLIWLTTKIGRSKMEQIILGKIAVLILILNFTHLEPLYKNASNAEEIIESSKVLEENSIVFPIGLREPWLQHHFSNYLAYSKPLVILENYEAALSWFPLSWKNKKFGSLYWKTFITEFEDIPSSNIPFSPNYIFLYGNNDLLLLDEYMELRNFLDNNTTRVYKSESSNYIQIFKLL